MQWIRRGLAAWVSTLTLIALAWTAPPALVLAVAYTGPCGSGPLIDYQNIVVRGAGLGGTGSDYHAVIGDAYVRTIATCSGPASAAITAVLPANLQVSSTNHIVQLGYAQCTTAAGYTCGDSAFPIPNDGQVHFVYICNDVSDGLPCNADHWAGSPVLGDRYRFELQWTSAGCVYSIKNYSTGVTKSATVPEDWEFGDGAWWGGEAYDQDSMLGPTAAGVNALKLYWMQYLRTATGSSWQVAEPVSLNECADVLHYCTGSWPSWFGGTVYSQNYTSDAVNIYTSAH